jgi:DNA (cytosine-5)-methyltransferase 1
LELVRDKFLTENYWRRHGISEQDSFPPSPTEAKLMAKLQNEDLEGRLPWVTVRDRLRDLPPPQVGGEDPNHYQHPGAKAYRNHTGSLPDEPAKALKAGAHGVPGGENMLAHLDGSVRYFTVREMALLQGFGRDFIATGGWRHVTRQLGNAVPAEIGEAFGKYIFKLLNEAIRQPLAA